MEDCQAIKDRRQLVAQLEIATTPHVGQEDYRDYEGTEEELNRVFSVLKGIIEVYQDGGDQIVENCTCGKHVFSKDHQRVGDLIVDVKDDDPITGSRWSEVPSIAIYLSTSELTTQVARLTWEQARDLETALMEVRGVAENG